MRATRSAGTLLDGVIIPDQYIARVVPAGAACMDAFGLAMFAWALLGFANVYYGLARHALDWTIAQVKNNTSLALSRSMTYHPEVRHAIAETALDLEAIAPHMDTMAQE